MTKKSYYQNMSYKEELINSIEPNFIFKKKPINRLKLNELRDENKNFSKIAQIVELKKLINSIQNCKLKDLSKNLVLGDGNINSPIMIVGESPGLEEESKTKTFQGEVGILLEKMLLAINLKRKDIYLSYAVNFRTPEDRKPTSQEIKRYSFFLKRHISIIDPKIIIIFGSTAMEAITGMNNRVSDERGKWKEIILKNKTYPLMITFNPSYLIRFPENKKFSWEDLKNIKQKIQELNIKI